MTLKERFEKDDKSVFRFKSICNFLNFCKVRKLTPENSETYYDKEKSIMYITKL